VLHDGAGQHETAQGARGNMELRDVSSSGAEETTITVLPETRTLVSYAAEVAPAPAPFLLPGEIVGDVYRVLDIIGQGGMGVVYRVEQIYLRQHYALKTLNARYSDNALMRFQKEAQAASALRHQNVVSADNFGLLENGLPYLVMDLALGETLGQYLKRVGHLTPAQMLEIIVPVCSALNYAHDKGVVHRDIKPNNIVITKTNSGEIVPKIVDFGIARLTDENSATDLTQTGEVFGTPYYMSPEQCMGKAVDQRSDIYALGCVIFEMLTGAPPFYGSVPLVVMMKHQVEEPPTLRQGSFGRTFPAELEEIVSTALAKDVTERYQTCAELEADLQEAVNAGKFGLVRKIRKKSRTKSWLMHFAWIWPTATLLICGALIAYLIAPTSEPEKHGSAAVKPEGASNEIGVESMFSAAVKRQYFSKIVGEGAQARRIFNFGDRPVGRIGFMPADPSKGTTWYAAEGVRSYPVDARICFRMDEQTLITNHADLLRCFRKDDLYQLLVHDQPEARMYSDRLDDHVFDEALVFGAHLKSLVDLDLKGTPVTIDGLRNIHIDELPNLSILNIPKTAVDLAELAHMKVIHRLGVMGLSYLPNPTPLLKAIRTSKNIEDLELRETGLKDADLTYLTAMTNLDKLNLSDNLAVTDKGIAKLAGLPTLHILELSGTSVTPGAMSSLAKMKQLVHLSLPTELWTRAEALALHERLPKCELLMQQGFQHRF
jgi:serine/threonine protein kinase